MKIIYMAIHNIYCSQVWQPKHFLTIFFLHCHPVLKMLQNNIFINDVLRGSNYFRTLTLRILQQVSGSMLIKI